MLTDMKRADGSIPKGYSATLLLLCATDAIGHGLLPLDRSKSCRWTSEMSSIQPAAQDDQIGNLKEFFRHGLAHVGTMAPDVYLLPNHNPGGHPFVFDRNSMLTSIWILSHYITRSKMLGIIGKERSIQLAGRFCSVRSRYTILRDTSHPQQRCLWQDNLTVTLHDHRPHNLPPEDGVGLGDQMNTGSDELSPDATDRRVGRRFLPLHARTLRATRRGEHR